MFCIYVYTLEIKFELDFKQVKVNIGSSFELICYGRVRVGHARICHVAYI